MFAMPTVEISGHLYNIRGEHSAERIRVLARYVDRRIQQVKGRVDTSDDLRVAVLAALNIADDYYETRKALERREEEISEQARQLADELGDAIGASDDVVGSEEATKT